jgi:hypothetical protein
MAMMAITTNNSMSVKAPIDPFADRPGTALDKPAFL